MYSGQLEVYSVVRSVQCAASCAKFAVCSELLDTCHYRCKMYCWKDSYLSVLCQCSVMTVLSVQRAVCREQCAASVTQLSVVLNTEGEQWKASREQKNIFLS